MFFLEKHLYTSIFQQITLLQLQEKSIQILPSFLTGHFECFNNGL